MLRSTPLPLLVIFTSVGALRKQHIESSAEGPKDSFAVTDYCNVGYSIESHASDDNHGDVCRDTQRGNTWTPPYGCERVDGPPWSVHLQTSVPCRAAAPVFAKKKKMPMIGFGTCCRASATGQDLEKSLLTYFALGGKLVDTAQTYGNHKNIANAIRVAGIPREELWITTKINTLGLTSAGEVFASVRSSLQELDLKYIDLVLLHTAAHNATLRTAQWKGLVSARLAGLVGQIGVSNWNKEHIKELVLGGMEKPAVNQLEYHPWSPPVYYELVQWCQNEGIMVTAYGSLGGEGSKDEGVVVHEQAAAHGVTASQLLLRWAVTQGVAVIPGATSEQHIAENMQTPSFSLSVKEFQALRNSPMPQGWRCWWCSA
uniref:NADP-dependent oxidoreductase domain-containing protein n=1 Tax=Noctiluca scintillans TaxID=2966 RepID=A0A7S1AE01_NOCSC|mmetsp:Transcript_42589/g.112392  ORF Transcript_42589/g.112392 Transcript_42589/m.112392 type:complete len:372 (+) Transcript_42589:69-1184(+)